MSTGASFADDTTLDIKRKGVKMKPKKQIEITNLIKLGNELNINKYPQSLFALVKKNGHFECGLHTRKTIDSIIKMIRKKYGYIKGEPFFVYEFPFEKQFIIYDSEINKDRSLNE